VPLADCLVCRHAQGEAERMLLAVRALRTRGELTERHHEIVALRADGASATAQVVFARLGERGSESGVAPRCFVVQRHRARFVDERLVGTLRKRCDHRDEFCARPTDFVADGGELFIPRVERRERRRRRPPARVFEQRVALAHDTLELVDQVEPRRVAGHHRVVDERTAHRRRAVDERAVVWREHGGAQHREQVAGAHDALAVDLRDRATDALQLDLDEELAPVLAEQLGAHERALGTVAHDEIVARAAERLHRREHDECLGEIRLALRVAPDERDDAPVERQRKLRVVAEVGELQRANDHDESRCGINK